MMNFEEKFSMKTNSKTPDDLILSFGKVRISVLTDRLVRVEYSENGFCDLPTQTVLNRNFFEPKFSVNRNVGRIEIKTREVTFNVSEADGKMSVVYLNNKGITDFKKGNLKGTRRTLDFTNGKVSIGDSIISRNGVTMMDDSKSLIIEDDGTVLPRKEKESDIYYFAYGHSYYDAIADYYKLTGETQLIPRFTLGNWWSRYKAYTQEEYLTLMQRFIDEQIPITVATIDMDWHWVDVVKEFGQEAANYKKPKNPITTVKGCYINAGWTGFSWNTKLFPDYKSFLNKLHDENLKVTLNVHPAVGIRFFEDMYEEFAKYMGIDSKSRQQIEFDLTDKKFTEGFFEFVNHKYEDEGVDFWWLDWQQEKYTKVKGLDPLWAVNHYYSLDSMRNNKRPLILSRFAGNGSHRYPLGFSGDTIVSWSSLNFQPYFTSTASNIGYSWWSHDIGGHQMGKRDDELYVRWLQFGAFSPIMRLHSSLNEFLGKEPWKFSHEADSAGREALRLRHRMIPYIYTMNRGTQKDGIPLMKPMYYDYPERDEAYDVPNEYMFGSELLVAPITKKTSPKTNMASTDVWLPDGRFTDIFTGVIYKGGNKFKMYRDTFSIPVLAKEGAIIPLSSDYKSNNWKNPESLEILAYRGNGSFKLYEDDGETMNFEKGEYAETLLKIAESQDNVVFSINAPTGDTSVVPQSRNFTVVFKDIVNAKGVKVTADGTDYEFDIKTDKNSVEITVKNINPSQNVNIILAGITEKKNLPKTELIAQLLSKIQCSNNMKVIRFSKCLNEDFNGKIMASPHIKGAMNEINNME